MTPIDELRQLCELYRKKRGYEFCEIKRVKKTVTILFWSINKTSTPDVRKSNGTFNYKYEFFAYEYNRFNVSVLPVHIDIMKEKLKEKDK